MTPHIAVTKSPKTLALLLAAYDVHPSFAEAIFECLVASRGPKGAAE